MREHVGLAERYGSPADPNGNLWEIRGEGCRAKMAGERYEPVTTENGLSEKGSASYHALGLYIVAPR